MMLSVAARVASTSGVARNLQAQPDGSWGTLEDGAVVFLSLRSL
ncbi:hypothetical protein [Longilinea arvoryzae]|nr:hypothetical protein [Longilinea arvoryzae]